MNGWVFRLRSGSYLLALLKIVHRSKIQIDSNSCQFFLEADLKQQTSLFGIPGLDQENACQLFFYARTTEAPVIQ